VASRVDVVQAETQLKTTQAQAIEVGVARAQTEHAIALLVGQPPSTFSLPPAPLESTPPAIPVGVPSALLERRPDIAAAERRMAAANATIGVAKAAFFPTIKLSALAGLQSGAVGSLSGGIGSLFDWPSGLWAVGPSLSQPLFQGGQLTGGLRQAKAAYEETVARYRQTVLTAFAQVEDNLAAEHLLASQYGQQLAAMQAARKQLEIATNRYSEGLVTYLEVATAQNLALSAERASARLRGQQLVAVVSLIKALGGGWNAGNGGKDIRFGFYTR